MYRQATLILLATFLPVGTLHAQYSTTFRDERLPLRGEWRFQLRRDNALLGKSTVRFGPVSASSHALILGPNSDPCCPLAGRMKTAPPYPVSSTLLGIGAPELTRQLWRPHPEQTGPTWWRADFGGERRLAGVRLRWANPRKAVSVEALVAVTGSEWQTWAHGASTAGEGETTIQAPRRRARSLKLVFSPSQFDGVKSIEVLLEDGNGSVATWAPTVKKAWYEEVRQFTPADGFEKEGFDDGAWPPIKVPGTWDAQGFSEPTWWQPDDTVGYYRRHFRVPEAWTGRHVRLRFEGVNSSAQVWVNGHELPLHESGLTAFEYDVSSYVRPGADNLIALRVAKWTLTEDYDTDDAWILGGIWRDTYLYALPAQRIDDYTVRTEFDSKYRDAILRVQLRLAAAPESGVHRAVVEGSLYDQAGHEVLLEGLRSSGLLTPSGSNQELAAQVPQPAKWTAETPSLYWLRLRLRIDDREVQDFRARIGFRQVEVRGDRLLLNGAPLHLRGAVTTRSNPYEGPEDPARVFQRELRLLKESNMNALRSHTTPLEEGFLDLCDEHGIYVVPDVPYVWLNEYDHRFLIDGLLQRTREVYAQQKNRPSVILWHIGNENLETSAYLGGGQAAAWLVENDPSRPVAICGNVADAGEKHTTITDDHYRIDAYSDGANGNHRPVLFGELNAVPEEVHELRDRGFVESWGRSLKLIWEQLLRRPWVAGGLICCWDDGAVNGNIGPKQWGILDSRRQPKTPLYHARKTFAPVRLALVSQSFSGGIFEAALAITNRYDFTDLAGFTFAWQLRRGVAAVATGVEKWRVPPGQMRTCPLKVESAAADRLWVEVFDPKNYSVQKEEFVLDGTLLPLKAAELLVQANLRPGPATGLASYHAKWDATRGLEIQDRRGRPLLSAQLLFREPTAHQRLNQDLGTLDYAKAQADAGGLSIPFTIRRDRSTAASGVLRFEYGASRVTVQYQMEALTELTVREAGLRLALSPDDWQAGWNRAPLWSLGPEGALEDAREHASLKALQETGSLRELYWLALEGSGGSLLATPSGERFHLRAGNAPGVLMLDDFLSTNHFLGRYDTDTVEKKLKPQEKLSGGLTLYLLRAAQTGAVRARAGL